MNAKNHEEKKHEKDMNENLNNQEANVNEPSKDQTPEAAPEQAAVQTPEQVLEAKCKQLEEEKDQLFNRLQRSLADMQNYQKKAVKDRQEAVQYTELSTIERYVFPVLDDLDRALKAAAEQGIKTDDPLYKGVDMIRQHIFGQLKQVGIERIEAEGKKFDLLCHEAIMELPTDQMPENTVVHVLNHGYTQHGKTIRAAKVVIAKPIKKEETQEATSEQNSQA
jgi:molecular chaperone GrpE